MARPHRQKESLASVKLTLVETLDDAMDCREWLGQKRDWLGFDIETSGLNLGKDRVRLAQIGDRDHGWAFQCEGPNSLYGLFKQLLEAYEGRLVAHNAIFDLGFLRRDGLEIPRHQVEDTMVMAQLDCSGMPVGLKPVARRLLDSKAVAGQAVLDGAMKQQKWDWATVPTDFGPYWQYGALDPVLTCRIAEKLWPSASQYLRSYEIEMGAIHALCQAEITGMHVDLEYCQRMSLELEAEMASLQPSLPCNPNAPQQVVRFLQDNGAVLTKKTDSGKLAADDEVLRYWEEKIPLCATVRRYRECSKLKSSYFDNLLELHKDSVVHPSIRVLGAQKTGRMSVTAPALQTLPKSPIGRNAFLAREGCTLMMADFSGIEMRLLAHMADEEMMIEKIRNGEDLHTWTAQQIFETETPASKQRDVAKRSGFAKIYGAGIEKFAYSTGLPVSEAEQFLTRYDQLFPSVGAFQDQVIESVRESTSDRRWGEVHTEFGRRLMVPKDDAYKGVNYRDQGTAGEVLKLKICELDAAGLGELIRLPIHDEIVFEVPDDDVPEVTQIVEEVMPERQLFKVPLDIDIEYAKRWGAVYE